MIRLFAALLLLVPAQALGAEAVVTRVAAGDTIEAGGRKVRLQGIGAPAPLPEGEKDMQAN